MLQFGLGMLFIVLGTLFFGLVVVAGLAVEWASLVFVNRVPCPVRHGPT